MICAKYWLINYHSSLAIYIYILTKSRLDALRGIKSIKAYLHAAICRDDLSAPRICETNLRVCFGLCGRD